MKVKELLNGYLDYKIMVEIFKPTFTNKFTNHFHTDNCVTLAEGEISELNIFSEYIDCEVVFYKLMDIVEYNDSIEINQDIKTTIWGRNSDIEEILCIMIKKDKEVK